MPSVFPALFDFSLIAVFIVRITAGFFFLIFGARLLRAAYAVKEKTLAIRSLGFGYGFTKLGIGILLVLGIFTQAAAIVGMFITALTFAQGTFSHSNKSTQQVQILLFVLCLSLLFMGAGAFGIDLQL